MKRVNGIKLRIGEREDTLISKLAKIERVNPSNVKNFKIVKKSLDARDKSNIFFLYNVDYSLTEESEPKKIYPQVPSGEAVVVGSGPCGLFCTLYLARVTTCGLIRLSINVNTIANKSSAINNLFFKILMRIIFFFCILSPVYSIFLKKLFVE
jgi:uncharacterized FAD-dependent dehydrogenase